MVRASTDGSHRADRSQFPFAWLFLMTHGNRVESKVGEVIAQGLRDARVRLPDRDAKSLLRWADDRYGF